MSVSDRPETVQALLREVSALPAEMRSVVALNVAAELVQLAAYEAAPILNRGDMAELIALSANLETKAGMIRLSAAANRPGSTRPGGTRSPET